MPEDRGSSPPTKGASDKPKWQRDIGALVFELAPVFCVAIDADGKIRKMNQTMLGALGYTADEVLGRDYMPLFVPERDREGVGRVFAKLIAMRGQAKHENWVVAKDGTEHLVEWHGNFLQNDEGEFECFLGVGIDITERKRVEDALRRSEQKLAFHVQETPLAVIEWDLDFQVTEWNHAAEKIFGYSREEALGRHAADLILPESIRPYIAGLWKDLLAHRGGRRGTNENCTKSGQIILCEWYNTTLVDDRDNVIGVASLVDDVTEQRRIEAELRAKERAQADTIERLSAPILDLWEGVLAMPVIGEVDERRASRMIESLLASIVRARASVTVIDLTGIDNVDASVAHYLLKMVRAAELLGCRCLVSGISPAVALSTLAASRDLGELVTFGTLRDALGHVLGAGGASAGRPRRGG